MFQYISCCYLSRKLYPDTPAVFVFQYISYCYLSVILKRKHRQEISFNTSHVVIYPGIERKHGIVSERFNTSHVVIYRTSAFFASFVASFQYISCCYLSSHSLAQQKDFFKFQYISCCYLSL